MKKILIFVSTLFAFLCCFFTGAPAEAAQLDYINSYDIKAVMRSDATVDFTYRISWKVLDSTTEGPLTWVKIGIPNQHVNEIKALTDNITKCKYYYDNGGTYIRCNFDREYYRNETVDFAFSFHQSYMFTMKGSDEIRISYTPGWFTDISVGSISVSWDATNVKSALYATRNGSYYTRTETNLYPGQTITVSFDYALSSFPDINLGNSTANLKAPVDWGLVIGLSVFALIVLVIIIIAVCCRDPYYSLRGFTDYYPYRYNYYIFRPHPHVRNHHGMEMHDPRIERRNALRESAGFRGGHSGGHCACACACACAGGGRAGCARKDFYHPNLESKRILDYLDRKKK